MTWAGLGLVVAGLMASAARVVERRAGWCVWGLVGVVGGVLLAVAGS